MSAYSCAAELRTGRARLRWREELQAFDHEEASLL